MVNILKQCRKSKKYVAGIKNQTKINIQYLIFTNNLEWGNYSSYKNKSCQDSIAILDRALPPRNLLEGKFATGFIQFFEEIEADLRIARHPVALSKVGVRFNKLNLF